MNWFVLLRLCFVFISVSAQSPLFEEDECKIENQNGKCISIDKCNYAKELIKAGKRPQHCGFKGRTPVVCCPISGINFGNKTSEKCKKYYPEIGEYDTAFFGATYSDPREFPHMALLGYGKKNNTQWLCGGSLISEYFVLTAAHCLEAQDLGPITKVRLGELVISETTDDANPEDYGIAETFPHPNFKPPSHYNDIALLKLDRRANINSFVKPACLYTDYDVPKFTLMGSGWGQSEFLGDTSDRLLKVSLDYIPHEKCAKSYANVASRKLKNGIIDEIQICAGAEDGRDACPGDSGGPLEFKNPGTRLTTSYYSVVGITSFGKACGVENSVGVYTRVAPFVAWIQKIVWP